LLIDSILNGFDIPKIYLHEFPQPRRVDDRTYRYAIVDGKQRLQSIWDFIEGKFPLRSDFEYFRDRSVQAAAFSYGQLSERYPSLKVKFDTTPLPILTIQTDVDELIEEMFSRLQDGAPLNLRSSSENVRGSASEAIRKLTDGSFFTSCLPFSNERYRHYDLAAKFLLLTEASGVTDIRKAYVDRFVATFAQQSDLIERLTESVTRVVSSLTQVFQERDSLLRSSGMIVLYFLLFREITANALPQVTRDALMRFEELRWLNKGVAEKDLATADYELLEFDRLSQNQNDKVSIAYRLDVLRRYLFTNQ